MSKRDMESGHSKRKRNLFEASITGSALSSEHEVELRFWDPKGGELYLCMVRSGETLLDASSGTDVQIVRLTRV